MVNGKPYATFDLLFDAKPHPTAAAPATAGNPPPKTGSERLKNFFRLKSK